MAVTTKKPTLIAQIRSVYADEQEAASKRFAARLVKLGVSKELVPRYRWQVGKEAAAK